MLKRLFLLFLFGVAALLGVYLLVVFQWSYSTGERAGWVQKFSRKGFVCKTWEGEMAMVTLPGTTPENFAFTVRDEAVARQINAGVGQRMRLHYEQHIGLPGTCFGETGYWVDSVVAVDPPVQLTPAQPQVAVPAPAPAPDAVPAPAAPAPATAPPGK